MKTNIIIFGAILFIIPELPAQQSQANQRKLYDAWITTYKSSKTLTGKLYEIKDSSIVFQYPYSSMRSSPAKPAKSTLDVSTIDVVKVRKKGNVGQGIMIGALTGIAAGAAIDLLYYASWEKSRKKEVNNLGDAFAYSFDVGAFAATATVIGIACIGTGIGIGAAIGSAKITIPIHGSRNQFDMNKAALNNYALNPVPGLDRKSFTKLTATVPDTDGNSYPTLALGGQVWMSGNLKVQHYRDGTLIPPSAVKVSEKGVMYSWQAVSSKRNLCPDGWHVPTVSEWTSMISSLGGETAAGTELEKGFNAEVSANHWWTSTEISADIASGFYLDNATVGVKFTNMNKAASLSVRCLRDN